MSPGYRYTSGRLDVNSLVPPRTISSQPFALLAFSAHQEESLRANIIRIFAEAPQYRAKDLAYTLVARKSRFLQQAFAVLPLPSGAETLPAIFDMDVVTWGKAQVYLRAMLVTFSLVRARNGQVWLPG